MGNMQVRMCVAISLFVVLFCVSVSYGSDKAVRPYTEAEQKMLEATNKAADAMVGWVEGGRIVVTAESLKTWANCIDYWNPLWDDETYALNTRYGSIIAAPYYLSGTLMMDMVKTPGVGTWGGKNNGELAEFFKPVRPGDVIRQWVERPVIEDVTEGDGPRTFHISTTICYINQRDELVYRATSFLTNSFTTESKEGGSAGRPAMVESERHVYTDEDWKIIENIAESEEIQGKEIRYWEDVNVGDEPEWVIAEPTTVIDMIKLNARGVMAMLPLREVDKEAQKELYKDEYGVYHWTLEDHYVGRNGRRSTHYMAFGKQVMARLITNWMGDDGWLKKADSKNYGEHEHLKGVKAIEGKKIIGVHGSEGDAVIAKAVVTKKYIEDGEHLVDVVVWTESITAEIWQNCKCTVKLVSREDEIKWK